MGCRCCRRSMTFAHIAFSTASRCGRQTSSSTFGDAKGIPQNAGIGIAGQNHPIQNQVAPHHAAHAFEECVEMNSVFMAQQCPIDVDQIGILLVPAEAFGKEDAGPPRNAHTYRVTGTGQPSGKAAGLDAASCTMRPVDRSGQESGRSMQRSTARLSCAVRENRY